MSKKTRQEYITECRTAMAEWREHYRPWVMLVRARNGVPLDRAERERQLLGLGYRVGKGKPVGIAYVYVVETATQGTQVCFGASMCHPRDAWDDAVGLWTAADISTSSNISLSQLREALASKTAGTTLHQLVRSFPRRARPLLRYMLRTTGTAKPAEAATS